MPHLTALRITVGSNASPSRPVHFGTAINHELNQIVIYNHTMSGIVLLLVFLPFSHTPLPQRVPIFTEGGADVVSEERRRRDSSAVFFSFLIPFLLA